MGFFCLVFAVSLCASVKLCLVVTCWERAGLLALVCALLSPAGKGLASWLSFVVSTCNCEFAAFPLVSWVMFGT